MSTPLRHIREKFKEVGALLSAFSGVWVIYCCRKSGLFKYMSAKNTFTPIAAISRQAKFNPRFTKTLVWAAHAFGLLEFREGKGFKLAPHMESLLVDRRNKYYLGDVVDLSIELSSTCKFFPELMVKPGGTFPGKLKRSTLGMMAQITRLDFSNIFENVINRNSHLRRKLESGGQILDLGSGLGEGAIFFATKFPKSMITGVDFDKRVIRHARKNITQQKLADRIFFLVKDAKEINFIDKFDFIYMNLGLHEICCHPHATMAFLKKCRLALAKNGVLLISEFPFFDDLRKHRNAVHQMLFGFQLSETVLGAHSTPINEFKSILKKARFASITQVRQPNPTRVFLLAKKD